jgi:hypothetical protein
VTEKNGKPMVYNAKSHFAWKLDALFLPTNE